MVESKASERHLKSLNSEVINNELFHQPLQELWWCTRGVDWLDEGWTNEGLVPRYATVSQFSIMSVWDLRKVCWQLEAELQTAAPDDWFSTRQKTNSSICNVGAEGSKSKRLLYMGLSHCICSGACRWHPRAQTRQFPAVLVQSQELIPVCRFCIRLCRACCVCVMALMTKTSALELLLLFLGKHWTIALAALRGNVKALLSRLLITQII